MSEKRYLRSERGLRVDQPDFQHGIEVSQRDGLAQVIDKFLVGDDTGQATDTTTQPKPWIVKGFDGSTAGLNLTINRGVALLGFRDRGAVDFSLVAAGGDASRTVAFDNVPPGTYGVYVRFEFRDEEFANRAFWNPIAPPPTEFLRNIPTRRAENWGLAFELQSPGTEWLKIGTAVRAAGLNYTDERNFFFESQAVNSHLVVDAEWGTTEDRETDRSLHGVFGLYRFAAAVRRQIQDIIGGTDLAPRQWSRALNAGKGLFEMLARDGSRDMAGNFKPDVDVTRDLGSATKRFLSFFTKNLRATQLFLEDTAFDVNMPVIKTSGVMTIRKLISTHTDSATGVAFREYAVLVSGNTMRTERTYNAQWNGFDWVGDDIARDAFIYRLGSSGIIHLRRNAPLPVNWADTAWSTKIFHIYSSDSVTPLTTDQNMLPARMFPRARALIKFGSGTPGTPAVFEQYGFLSFAYNGTDIDATLDAGVVMANSTYQVWFTAGGLAPTADGRIFWNFSITSSSAFKIQARGGGGAVADLSALSDDRELSIVVFGNQIS